MKRFFQGLGVGILGTTLIFSIAYYTIGNKKMTDAQIMNEAGKLGMVKATEAPLFTDNQGEQTPDDTQQQAQPGNGDAQQPDGSDNSEQGDAAGSDSQNDNGSPDGQNDAADSDNQSDNGNADGQNDSTNTEQTQPDENNNTEHTAADSAQQSAEGQDESSGDVVTVTIEKGDGATIVSQKLQNGGVISDAVDYDKYLRDVSKTHSIQTGTFQFRPGMSYEEITAVLSSKQ